MSSAPEAGRSAEAALSWERGATAVPALADGDMVRGGQIDGSVAGIQLFLESAGPHVHVHGRWRWRRRDLHGRDRAAPATATAVGVSATGAVLWPAPETPVLTASALEPKTSLTGIVHEELQQHGRATLVALGLGEDDAAVESRLLVDTFYGTQVGLGVDDDDTQARAAFTRALDQHRARLLTLTHERDPKLGG